MLGPFILDNCLFFCKELYFMPKFSIYEVIFENKNAIYNLWYHTIKDL